MASIPTSICPPSEAPRMRDQPSEAVGSRTRLRYKVELLYEVLAPTDFIFNVHAQNTPQQHVLAESVTLAPDVPFVIEREPAAGNRLLRTRADDSGPFRVRYECQVEVAHYLADPANVVSRGISELPASVLRYLWPS